MSNDSEQKNLFPTNSSKFPDSLETTRKAQQQRAQRNSVQNDKAETTH